MENPGDDRSPTHGIVIVVRTTYPDRVTAEDQSRKFVAASVAACGQIEGPTLSTYVWQGAIERAEEWRCTLKTSSVALPACLAAIRASHPYAVPELTWERVRATSDYAAWVEGVTSRLADEPQRGETP